MNTASACVTSSAHVALMIHVAVGGYESLLMWPLYVFCYKVSATVHCY